MLAWPARLALLALVQVAESSQETFRVASARFSHVGDATTSSAHSRRFNGKDAFARSKSIAIIPQPKNMEVLGGDDLVFHSGALRLSVPSTVESDAFYEHVIGKTNLKVDAQVDLPQIILEVQRGPQNPQPEKYTFLVSSEKNEVRITGSTSHGLFNGLMTLRQLFVQGDAGEWRLPQVKIRDEPQHEWRGLMLDVSRHFFNASEVKHLLRTMASFKMNRFHWHLSDDQGWRIPSQKYPKLTEVGAWREGTQIGHNRSIHDHVRYGGSYTADEMRSIVAYAKSLHIEIIPEIDSSGHIQAALAAYPELGNVGAKVATQFGALQHTMKPSETSMHFISDVIGETAQLVDSRYFHVGGDEVATKQWSRSTVARDFMASHRLRRVEGIAGVMTQNAINAVKHLGRRAVVWDDAMYNGVPLPRGTVVMLWRPEMGVNNLAKAAQQGHAVVMCPQDRTYLDQFQSPHGDHDAFGAIGGFLNTRKVYELGFNGRGAKVLGGQGQLWSEYISGGVRELDYKAWPRGAALAEATWSGRHRPGFGDFQRRLELLQPELRRMQVNFRDADGQQALSTAKAIEVHRAAWRFSIWGPLLASYASLAWLCFFALGDKKERKELKGMMWLDLHEA